LTKADWLSWGLTPRDHALGLLIDLDLEAQLIAIRALLRRNTDADKETEAEITALKDRIEAGSVDDEEYLQHLENHWIDTMHGAVFQDAAHSMAAVGMLAPFFEALFVAIFEGLRQRATTGPKDDPRAEAMQAQYWNPRYVVAKGGTRRDIVTGIAQLASSTRLHTFLPGDYRKTLDALFGYRNAMFHNGMEWPIEERERFANRIKTEGWPENWFLRATTNDQPWVFYMSEAFITACLNLIDQVLEGVGRYIEQVEANQS
jgi:hypothetical protein